MRQVLLVAVVVVALLSGCGSSFSSLGDFTLGVGDWSAELLYDDQTLGCQTMASDFAATMDDQPAHGVIRGGKELNSLGGETRCQHPLISFNMMPVMSRLAVLDVTAGGEHIEARVLGVAQFVIGDLILEPGQVVHPGDTVSIQLGPLFERLTWPRPGTAMVREANGATGDLAVDPIVSPSGVLKVTLPAGLPPGLTELQVHASTTPVITGCDAPNCLWTGGEIHPVLNASVQVVAP